MQKHMKGYANNYWFSVLRLIYSLNIKLIIYHLSFINHMITMPPHSRILTEAEMNAKISTIQKRRGFIPWNDNHPNAHKAAALQNTTHFDRRFC